MPGLLSALVALQNQYGAPATTTPSVSGTPTAMPADTAPVADWTQYYESNPSVETPANDQAVWTYQLNNQNWLQQPAYANAYQGYDSAVGLSAPTAAQYTEYDTYEQQTAAINAQNAANAAAQSAEQTDLSQEQSDQALAQQYQSEILGIDSVLSDSEISPTERAAYDAQLAGIDATIGNYTGLAGVLENEVTAEQAIVNENPVEAVYGPSADLEYNITPTQAGGGTATAVGTGGDTLYGTIPLTAIAAGMPLIESDLLAHEDQLQGYTNAVESNGTGWRAGPNGMPVPNGQGGYNPGAFGGTGSGLISDSGTGIDGAFAGGTPSGGPIGAINPADAAPGGSFGQGGGGGFGGGAADAAPGGSGDDNPDYEAYSVDTGGFGGPPSFDAPAADSVDTGQGSVNAGQGSADTGQGFATDPLPSDPNTQSFPSWLSSFFPTTAETPASGDAAFGGPPQLPPGSVDTGQGFATDALPSDPNTPSFTSWLSSLLPTPADAMAQVKAAFGGGAPEAPASGDAAFGGPPQLPPGATDITPATLAQPDIQAPVPIADTTPALPAPEVTPSQQTIDFGAGFGATPSGPAAPTAPPGPENNFGLPAPDPQTASEKFVEQFGPTTTLRQVLSTVAADNDGNLPGAGVSLSTALWALGGGVDTPIDLTNPAIAQQLTAALSAGNAWGTDKAVSGFMSAMANVGQTPQGIADAASDVVQDRADSSDAAYGLPRQTFDTIHAEQNAPSIWSSLLPGTLTAPTGPAMNAVPNQDIIGQPIYTDEQAKFPDSGQDITGQSFGTATGVPSAFASAMGLNASSIAPGADLAGQPTPDVTYGQFNTNMQSPDVFASLPAQGAPSSPGLPGAVMGATPEDIPQEDRPGDAAQDQKGIDQRVSQINKAGSVSEIDSGSGFNYYQNQGERPSDVDRTTVQTPYGPITVAADAAPDFSSFFETLDDAGFPAGDDSGSYNPRTKYGSGSGAISDSTPLSAISSHAYGAAVDINNSTALTPAQIQWIAENPDVFQDALQDNNIAWGHGIGLNFGPDNPHMEWTGPGTSGTPTSLMGTPQQFTGEDAPDASEADLAAQRFAPGDAFSNTDWAAFEAQARPSQNVEDVRSGFLPAAPEDSSEASHFATRPFEAPPVLTDPWQTPMGEAVPTESFTDAPEEGRDMTDVSPAVVGNQFSNTLWSNFEANATPSSNIEDARTGYLPAAPEDSSETNNIATQPFEIPPELEAQNPAQNFSPSDLTQGGRIPNFGALQGQPSPPSDEGLPTTPAQEAVATSDGGVEGNINPSGGGGGPQAGAPYTYGFVTGGAGIPANLSPTALYALNQLAQSTGYSPEALAAVIQEESEWNPQATTGAYSGLFQMGAGSGVPSGGALTGMSAAQQLPLYQDWMNFYNLPSRIQEAGIVPSDMTPAEQAAMIQGLQFAPNSQSWLSNIVSGNLGAPATTSKQAANLGTTSFNDMLKFYGPYIAAHPSVLGTPANR